MAIHSEDDFLALIDRFFPKGGPGLLLGRGDDAAVLELSGPLCLSTDLFLEGEHFCRDWMNPEEAGYKALAVNISDMVAMGARPLGFSLGLIVPRPAEEAFWSGFLRGMAGLAGRYGLPLAGGDLSAGDRIGVCLTIWGAAMSGRFLGRVRAVAPDLPAPVDEIGIFVLAEPGLARTGLDVLRAFGREQGERLYPRAVAAQLRPNIMLEQAALLAADSGVLAMMDLSDGLARDLPRLIGPSYGADIRLELEMLEAEALAWSAGLDPFQMAFLGGEEYGLLGLGRMEALSALQSRLPGLLIVGKLRPEPGLLLNGRLFRTNGFDHFG